MRKGTHDYYNERGLEMMTWDGHRFVAQGDAHMRPQDAERAATAVRDSLAQLLGALDDKANTDAAADGFAETEPEAFDVCQQSHFPALAGTVAEMRVLVPIIEQTPVPALGPGPASCHASTPNSAHSSASLPPRAAWRWPAASAPPRRG